MKEELDNPVWYALTETQHTYSLSLGEYKFYQPAYGPFGACLTGSLQGDSLAAYGQLTNDFFIVGNKPSVTPDGLQLTNELVCKQMLVTERIDATYTDDIILLNEEHRQELIDLVNLVQPGYFKEKTAELGDYFGIVKAGKLIAVTGERMKMNRYTELSAVVTHPEHLGKGYARQLVSFVTNKIFDENKTPFLHVAATNTGAIKLYEKLGYQTKQEMMFYHYSKK